MRCHSRHCSAVGNPLDVKHGAATSGAELTGRGETILHKYPLLRSSLRQCCCICHRVIIGTIFACAHNFKRYICQQLELFQINSFNWAVDLSQNLCETRFQHWASLGEFCLVSLHGQNRTSLDVRDKGLCFRYERLKTCIAKISW